MQKDKHIDNTDGDDEDSNSNNNSNVLYLLRKKENSYSQMT